MSSNAGLSAKSLRSSGYFGRTLGSPPGVPGGGITGMLPVSAVGARISGSTPDGGHNTPSDLASLSPRGSARRPVVEPSGAMVPRGGTGRVGEQPPTGAGGAVWAGGVAAPGGACALAASDAAISTQKRNVGRLIRMRGKRRTPTEVPGNGPQSIVASELATVITTATTRPTEIMPGSCVDDGLAAPRRSARCTSAITSRAANE